MSVKTYVQAQIDGEINYTARYVASYAVKRGGRLSIRRMRFTVTSAVSWAACETTAFDIAETVDTWTHGQLVGLVKILGHYIKDEATPAEPAGSRTVMLLNRNAENNRKISGIMVPHVKNTIAPATLEAAMAAAPFTSLAHLQLADDGMTLQDVTCAEFAHITYKNTAEISDTVVVSGDVKDDSGADGMIDGTA